MCIERIKWPLIGTIRERERERCEGINHLELHEAVAILTPSNLRYVSVFFYTFFDPTELLGFVLFLFIHSTFVNNLLIMFQYSSTESMHNAQFSAMQFKILLSKMMHETTMSEAFISHVSCNEFSPLLPFSFKANFNCFRFSMCFSVANIKRTLHSYYLSNCSCCFSQIKWLASRDTRLRMVWYFFYCMVWTLMFF